MDIVPNPEKEGRMQTLPMLGKWFAGLQYNISKNVFVSGTYSLSRLYSEHTYPSDEPDMYRKGQYLVANLFWNVTSNLQVGAEYLRGWRNRLQQQYPPCQPYECIGTIFVLTFYTFSPNSNVKKV